MQALSKITTKNDRRAPEGKYRVILNDRTSDNPTLYYVSDQDTAEEAFVVAETLSRKGQNGIVQNSEGFVLYPWFDGHHLHTREELLRMFSRGKRKLTEAQVDELEKNQADRIPGWQPGHRLVVFWRDIANATGAEAYPGNF